MLELVKANKLQSHYIPETCPAGSWVMTNFLFCDFHPDQSIRLPIPVATIKGEAPHPRERGKKGLGRGWGGGEVTKGTGLQGLTDASCWGVCGNSVLISILSVSPASSSAILRETDARSSRPLAKGEWKPVAGPRDKGRHFYDGPWSWVWRRIKERLPVRFPEAGVTAYAARGFPCFLSYGAWWLSEWVYCWFRCWELLHLQGKKQIQRYERKKKKTKTVEAKWEPAMGLFLVGLLWACFASRNTCTGSPEPSKMKNKQTNKQQHSKVKLCLGM